MANTKNIEVKGLKELMRAFDKMPKEVGPSVIQKVARKPANKVVSEARKLFPYHETGATKRTFGIKRIKNKLQTFVEVGIKGRSLGYIFLGGTGDRKHKSGKSVGEIKPLGNIFEDAAGKVVGAAKDMAVDIEKILVRTFKRYSKRV